MPQLGSALLISTAPKFSNYVVVEGTWKEKDSTQMQRTDDGDGNVYNYAFWQPGADCSCDLVIKGSNSRLAVGGTLAESSPGTRTFVVISVDTSDFGGKPLKQTVQLAQHTGFTPTVVT
ncbi:MAG: hypothetical protein ACOYNN_04170 [Terrimicrobiaceae bacterium]